MVSSLGTKVRMMKVLRKATEAIRNYQYPYLEER